MPACDTGEMVVEGTRPRPQSFGPDRRQTQRLADRLAIAGGIYEEFGANDDVASRPRSQELPAVRIVPDRVDIDLIDLGRPSLLRPLDQMSVEVGPEPARIGTRVIGARGAHGRAVVRGAP